MRAQFGCRMQHTALAATTPRIALTVVPTNSDPAVTDAAGSPGLGIRTTLDSRRGSSVPAASSVDALSSVTAMLVFSTSIPLPDFELASGHDDGPTLAFSPDDRPLEQASPSRETNL
jgi:hypothetical protein